MEGGDARGVDGDHSHPGRVRGEGFVALGVQEAADEDGRDHAEDPSLVTSPA